MFNHAQYLVWKINYPNLYGSTIISEKKVKENLWEFVIVSVCQCLFSPSCQEPSVKPWCILDWCDGIIVRGHDRLWTQKAQWLTSALDCHEFPSAPRGLSTCARCVSSSSMTSLTIPTFYSLRQLTVIPTIIFYLIRVQRFANFSGVKWQIILLTAKIFMPSFLSQKLGGKSEGTTLIIPPNAVTFLVWPFLHVGKIYSYLVEW